MYLRVSVLFLVRLRLRQDSVDSVDPVSAASSGAAGSLKGSLNVTLPRKFRFVSREGRGCKGRSYDSNMCSFDREGQGLLQMFLGEALRRGEEEEGHEDGEDNEEQVKENKKAGQENSREDEEHREKVNVSREGQENSTDKRDFKMSIARRIATELNASTEFRRKHDEANNYSDDEDPEMHLSSQLAEREDNANGNRVVSHFLEKRSSPYPPSLGIEGQGEDADKGVGEGEGVGVGQARLRSPLNHCHPEERIKEEARGRRTPNSTAAGMDRRESQVRITVRIRPALTRKSWSTALMIARGGQNTREIFSSRSQTDFTSLNSNRGEELSQRVSFLWAVLASSQTTLLFLQNNPSTVVPITNSPQERDHQRSGGRTIQINRAEEQHSTTAWHSPPSLLLLVCFILSKSGSGLNQTLRVKSLHLSPICRLVVMTTNTHTDLELFVTP
ncbi:unnamed protein product [Leuciscus chuanchicus]